MGFLTDVRQDGADSPATSLGRGHSTRPARRLLTPDNVRVGRHCACLA